jgi:hypothetical protein
MRRRRGTRRVQSCTMRGGGDRSASGSTSSHRLRSSHLVHPPVAPHDDNRVVIVPCGDGWVSWTFVCVVLQLKF